MSIKNSPTADTRCRWVSPRTRWCDRIVASDDKLNLCESTQLAYLTFCCTRALSGKKKAAYGDVRGTGITGGKVCLL